MAHLFLIHTGNLTSDETEEHLAMAAKHKENRKPWENFPLVHFPTTSYAKTYTSISLHYGPFKKIRACCVVSLFPFLICLVYFKQI